jgi:hypothetical protein
VNGPRTTLLGLISTYKEGPTARHAIRTALEACDRVLVCEGPAGPPLQADVPETDMSDFATKYNRRWYPDFRDDLVIQHGRWSSDAKKRTWMLNHARETKLIDGPTFGLWLDGDEILVNPQYLRDWTDYATWHDHERLPLRLIDQNGAISVTLVKLVRVDLIRSYEVSLVNTTGPGGETHQAGNFQDTIQRYQAVDPERWSQIEQGYLFTSPGPAPLDPYIVHRPLLRHPARAGLRMNEQEAAELAKRRGASGSPSRQPSGLPPAGTAAARTNAPSAAATGPP